jgi:predicted PurR-regulated permease PerM
MTDPETQSVPTPPPRTPIPASAVTTGVLAIITGIVAWLCYLVAEPFLPALAWALALAVVAHPVYSRIERRWHSPNLCAGTAVVAIALMLMTPAAFVTQSLAQEAAKYARVVEDGVRSGRWEEQLKNSRIVGPLVRRLSELATRSSEADKAKEADKDKGEGKGKGKGSEGQPEQTDPPENPSEESTGSPTPTPEESEKPEEPRSLLGALFHVPSSSSLASAAGAVTARVGLVVSGIGWAGMQVLITLMCLFYFLRDRQTVLKGVRSVLPLSDSEADRILKRVDDTIHATIFGSVTVACVQGAMGGFMFWMLGLPSPLFWGTVMGILAVVPILGTFVIWAPTAVSLALQGDWTRAMVLAGWGAVAIGTIDNFLYPYLVGNRMRFHTLLVFFSIVGGLSVFGAAGVILGPVLLAVADGLIQVWHRRVDASREAA